MQSDKKDFESILNQTISNISNIVGNVTGTMPDIEVIQTGEVCAGIDEELVAQYANNSAMAVFGIFAPKNCLKVTAKDDDLQIKNIIVNKGNCNYAKYMIDTDKKLLYQDKYPKRVKNKKILLRTKNQELVPARAVISWSGVGKHPDEKYYMELDDESKAIYKPMKFFTKQMSFGQTNVATLGNCNILEIKLETEAGAVYRYDIKEEK